MRILVIAGTGFVGAAVVRRLSEEHEVTVFHRGRDCAGPNTVRHIHGDRTQLADWRSVFRALKPDVALDMTPRNEMDAGRTIEALAGIAGRLTGVSSVSVYRAFGVLSGLEDHAIDNDPVGEEGPLRARLHPYRGAKRRAPGDPDLWLDTYEKILAERAFLQSAEIPASIVRLPQVYGPGDPDQRVGRYAAMMRSDRGAIRMPQQALAWRNARGFVENVASAIGLVVTRGAAGRVYNVAEREDFDERTWVQRIGQAAGWRGGVTAGDHGEGAVLPLSELSGSACYAQHLRMCTDRIRAELGYREPFDVDTALRLTVSG